LGGEGAERDGEREQRQRRRRAPGEHDAKERCVTMGGCGLHDDYSFSRLRTVNSPSAMSSRGSICWMRSSVWRPSSWLTMVERVMNQRPLMRRTSCVVSVLMSAPERLNIFILIGTKLSLRTHSSARA